MKRTNLALSYDILEKIVENRHEDGWAQSFDHNFVG